MTTAAEIDRMSDSKLRDFIRSEGLKPALWVKAANRSGMLKVLEDAGYFDSKETVDEDTGEITEGGDQVLELESEDIDRMVDARIVPLAKKIEAQNAALERAANLQEGTIRKWMEAEKEIKALRAAVEDLEKKAPARPLEIRIADGSKEKILKAGKQHFAFPVLFRALSAGCHVFLVGPAGSGKTRGAEEAAKLLKREFFPMSVGPQSTQSHIMGYMDAGGRYIRTAFRDAFEKGGLFLLDEIDAGNPGVLTCLNAALANEYCSFPDGIIKRHANFICVAAGNTWGTGADRQYVGRNQIDAATLDRFAFVPWDYDENLEREIAGDTPWTARVQALRAAVFSTGIRLVISPRASIAGNKLLAAGMERAAVEESLIWKGADKSTRDKVTAGVRL